MQLGIEKKCRIAGLVPIRQVTHEDGEILENVVMVPHQNSISSLLRVGTATFSSYLSLHHAGHCPAGNILNTNGGVPFVFLLQKRMAGM